MGLGFGVLCAISGTVTFLIGLRNVLLVRRLRQHGIHTSGLVVDQTQVTMDSGNHHWKPITSFTDQRGHTVTFQPSVGGTGYGLRTGQTVPVVYLADNPKKVRVDMPRFMTRPGLVMMFVRLVILGVAVDAIANPTAVHQ